MPFSYEKFLISIACYRKHCRCGGHVHPAPLCIRPCLGIKIKDPFYFVDFIDSNNMLFASESCMLLSQCVLKMQSAFSNTLSNKEFCKKSYSPYAFTSHSKVS